MKLRSIFATNGLVWATSVDPEELGFIPSFLDRDDDRPAAEQIDANYQHGGGWRAQDGFTLDAEEGTLNYPGDPAFEPLALTSVGDETVVIYPYGYVAVVQADGTFEASRID